MTTAKALSIIKKAGMLRYIAKGAVKTVCENPTTETLEKATKDQRKADKFMRAHGINVSYLDTVFVAEDCAGKNTAWPLEYVAAAGLPTDEAPADAHDIENDDAAQLDGEYND